MRRLAILAAACAAAASLAAVPARASAGAQFGIQDDAWLMDGAGSMSDRIATLQRIGVKLVRFTLRWDQVATSRPAAPRDPQDPAYEWGQYAEVLQALHADRIAALVTIYGAPAWANGGHGPNWLPASTAAGDFAYAAAKEFPWVHLWTAWNEPNTRVFSVPVSPSMYVTHVLNPVYAGLHAASRANRVAGGVTSPRQTPSGMSPAAFAAGMRAARARLDAYAQNPYPRAPVETPFDARCSNCSDWTMARLGAIRSAISRLFGPKPIWLTEYGYETSPPDRFLGVSLARQAAYIGEAGLRVWEEPGVTVLIQFLVRDQPNLGGWQSGLFTTAGTQKPSYDAFGLPLAEVSRHGTRIVLWGQVRPGSGRRPYVLQRLSGRRWVTLGGTARTASSGTFERTLALPRGARVRIRSPLAGYTSPPLTIS
ncbi:MAG TPA: hypothetical protein VKC62_12975 [Gaiellaceae bacterium]|nr:hypothetical protein [Gaiellaceae bacterium]